jgi:signal transduction histidine kinase
MTAPNSLWPAIALVAILTAAVAIVLYRASTKRTLASLHGMLDAAIDNRFSEQHLDESQLSALEAKFARYLSIGSLSSTQLTAEKNKIQTLISDISHQTKTPIANLVLYAQLLRESRLPPDSSAYVDALLSKRRN